MLGWSLVLLAIVGFLFALHHFMVKWTVYRVTKDATKRIGNIDIYDIRKLLGK
jgi:hypothetical protein